MANISCLCPYLFANITSFQFKNAFCSFQLSFNTLWSGNQQRQINQLREGYCQGFLCFVFCCWVSMELPKMNTLTEPLKSYGHLVTIPSSRMTANKMGVKGARPTLAKNLLCVLRQILIFNTFWKIICYWKQSVLRPTIHLIKHSNRFYERVKVHM